MRVRFLVDHALLPLSGTLVYKVRDTTFDFEATSSQQLAERKGLAGVTSVVVGTLQIEVGVETSLALFVWGYQPRTAWRTTRLPSINPRPGGIRLALTQADPEGFESGMSISLVEINEWPTVFDPSSGWVCVGSADTSNSVEHIAFASDTVAALRGEELVALWLHPRVDV